MRDNIDPMQVDELRKQGWSYTTIGRELAARQGRRMPYTPTAVKARWLRWRKTQRGCPNCEGAGCSSCLPDPE